MFITLETFCFTAEIESPYGFSLSLSLSHAQAQAQERERTQVSSFKKCVYVPFVVSDLKHNCELKQKEGAGHLQSKRN
jgi:hypothetical protein